MIGTFISVIVYMLQKLAESMSLAFALMLAGLMLVNLVWVPRLKRRTVQGCQMLDQIAGFRLFLEKVEKDRLDKLNAVGEAPEMLEAFVVCHRAGSKGGVGRSPGPDVYGDYGDAVIAEFRLNHS